MDQANRVDVRPGLKVLVAIEASRLDGPIRNLLYAVQLLQHSVQFRFVTFVRPGQEENELVRHFQAAGLITTAIRERGRFDLNAAREFGRILRSFSPQVVQVHHTKSRLFSVFYATVLRLIDRRSLLFFFHGETWTNRLQKLYNTLDRRLFRSAARVVAVSEAQTHVLRDWGVSPERIVVIPNAIPERPARSPRALDQQAFRVMTAGRLSLEKGQRYLVEAVARIPLAVRSKLVVDVYGDGPETGTVQALVESSGVKDTMRLQGYCADIWPEFLRTDLFVLPSLSEGLPNVLLEAAMAGVPIVATAVGGIPALFHDRTEAHIVPAADAAALASAMEEFIAAPNAFDAMAQRARVKVLKLHSPSAKAQAMLRLYNEMVQTMSTPTSAA
jgi:glycosyltransferase involved in cell wall biosynthesis